MSKIWSQEWQDALRHRRPSYWSGVRDGFMLGVVFTVLFAYVWCHFGGTT